MSRIVDAQHLARYRFARDFVRGKRVADIACGSGYGTKMPREVAASVDGYDIKNFGFNYVIDLEREVWKPDYDVIVSFETLGHLANPEFFWRTCAQNRTYLCFRRQSASPMEPTYSISRPGI